MGSLFGTDGVRGLANDALTPTLAFDLARAAGTFTGGPVIIGRDTRRSGPMLVSALEAGFNAVGVDTVNVGILPVGGVSRLTKQTGARYGVMVSASHNPAPDNGIKFFGRDGRKLDDDREAAIEHRYEEGPPWPTPIGQDVGIQSAMDDSTDRYIEFLGRDTGYSFRGISVVLDCAHGAAFLAAPRLFHNVKAEVETLNAAPNGVNINEGCGATHPEYLAERHAGRIGFAFDGDADRLIAVDEAGRIVNGDVLLAILAKHRKEQGKLKRNVVVTTVMANLGFRRAMERLGIDVVETGVGDRYVLEAMQLHGAVVGGEQSGHIILDDRVTGDGLRSALAILEVVAATGKPLSQLSEVMTEYPQVLKNVPVSSKDHLNDASEIWDAVQEAEAGLGDDGRVLVRASGTEQLVRVMVEAADADVADSVAGELADVVADALR